MTKTPSKNTHPRYLDVLINTTLSAWFYAGICSIIYAIIIGGFSFDSFILSLIFSLFIGGTITFAFAGLVTLPLWILFRKINQLNSRSAFIAGALTGLLGSLIICFFPMDFSGNISCFSKTGLSIITLSILLGGISGWTGFKTPQKGNQA